MDKMSAQLGNLKIESFASEQCRDLGTETDTVVALIDRVAQDVTHLFFHAAAIVCRTALQTYFHRFFQISHYELRHLITPRSLIS